MALFAWGMAFASVGCASPGTTTLEWSIELESAEDLAASVQVEALIREGSCGQANPVRYATTVRRDEMAPGMRPRPLEPGRYGLSARAGNARCEWIAAGCREVELPVEGPVVVTLSSTSPEAACAPTECEAGRCATRDAGARDGEPDAGPEPGSLDAGMDAMVVDADRDASTDGRMDRGDAGEETMPDAAVDAGPVDAGGCRADDAGFCAVDGSSGRCWGEVCCTGCWDGSECLPGTSDRACGAIGQSCRACPSRSACEPRAVGTGGLCAPSRLP